MPLIPETGLIVAGANSYVDLAYADAYFENHPFFSDAWSELTSPQKEGLLIYATRQLDLMFNWVGEPVRANEQTLGWPRTVYSGLTHPYIIANNVVPDRVKQAVCELAFHLSRGDPFAASSSEGLESLRVDVIELQFSGSTAAKPLPAPALVLLRGLGDYAFGGRMRKVVVG